MQNKIVVAAALAASTTALKIETPKMSLAQAKDEEAGHYGGYGQSYGHGYGHGQGYGSDAGAPEFGEEYCKHYGYTYECLEKKITATLGAITDDLEAAKASCLTTADDLRASIVSGVQQLRASSESALQYAVQQAEDRILAQTQVSIANVNAARDAANAALGAERNAIEGRVQAAREATGDAAAKLYHKVGGNNGIGHGIAYAQEDAVHSDYIDPYTLSEEIKKLVAAFDALIDAEGEAWEAFVEAQLEGLDAVASAEAAVLAELSAAEMDAFNNAAADATLNLAGEISNTIASMDQAIAEKTATINATIQDLTDNFEDRFWEQLEELYKHVEYHERQALVWKALHKKDAFLDAAGALRDMLIASLGDVRSTLVGELNAERDGFAGFIADSRTQLTNFITAQSDNLASTSDAARDSFGERADSDSAALDAFYLNQGKVLEDLLYKLAQYAYKPHSYYYNGHQPYVGHVTKNLKAQISVFGDQILADYDAATQAAMESAEATLASEQAALAADNTNLQEALTAHTQSAIEHIIASREKLQTGLDEEQEAQEKRDEEASEVLKVALVSTKNQLWKDLSWITRKQYTYGAYGYGNAGYGYGFDKHTEYNHHDQSDFEYFDDDHHDYHDDVTVPHEHIKSYGHGHHDSHAQVEEENSFSDYTYRNRGYGYGGYSHQRYGYKEAKAKIAAMAEAVVQTKADHDALIAESWAALQQSLIDATEKYDTDYIQVKEANFNAFVQAQNETWAQIVADRTATVMGAINDAEAFIAEQSAAKREALAARAKEIKWAISSVYEALWKKKLEELLDEAVAGMNATCDQREAMFAERVQAARDAWNASVDTESASLAAHTAVKDAECEAAQAEQTAIFAQYVVDALARFDAWAEAAAADMDAHIEDCEEAWQWILKSYCLVGGFYNNDKHHYGHGCGHAHGYGQEYGYGGNGYGLQRKDKSVPIEEHDELLKYGQELEIKGIENLDERRQKTVDIALETVPEFVAELTASVEEQQQAIHAAIIVERERLEAALAERLANSIASLDATIARVEAEARQHLDDQVTEITGENTDAIDAVNALKEVILHEIKELAYKLNWTYGYSDEDAELKQMIVDAKQRFEDAIQATLDDFEARAAAAEEAQDNEHARAVVEYEAEATRLTAEMEQAIADAIVAFTNVLAEAKAQFTDVTNQATADLNAHLAERHEWWNRQMAHELKHAKWTKDSYYRYHLIRLIQAKDEDVVAALQAVRDTWAAHVAAEQEESATFRAEQSLIGAAYVATVRQDLADAVAADRAYWQQVWSDMDEELEAFLQSERERINAAMDESREWFKAALKKIYGFDYGHVDKHETKHGYNNYAPYSHHQHQQFIWKFKVYHDQQLTQISADVYSMMDYVNAQAANLSDASATQSEGFQNSIANLRSDLMEAIAHLSSTAIEEYGDSQDIELENLQEFSATLQAAALARCEELRKEIIYATHVLRYAGKGHQYSNNYNFKGKLTGIDQLDTLDIHHGSYAQVLEKSTHSYDDEDIHEFEHSDEHIAALKQLIDDSKQAFDDMIQETRDEFRAAVDETLDESEQRRQALNDLVANAGDESAALLGNFAGHAIDTQTADNQGRSDSFQADSQARLDALIAYIQEQRDLVNEWFGDRLEWTEKLSDEYYRKQLQKELIANRDGALADLDNHQQQGEERVAAARENLRNNQDAALADLVAFALSEEGAFAEWDFTNRATVQEAGQDISEAFAAAAEAEDAALNEWLDALVTKWAWWMKKFYGYSGYASHYYDGYHADYSDDWHSDEEKEHHGHGDDYGYGNDVSLYGDQGYGHGGYGNQGYGNEAYGYGNEHAY